MNRLKNPLYEYFYNTINGTLRREHDMDSSVAILVLIKSKSPTKKASGGPLLAMNNHDSEESTSSDSPTGGSPSVDYTPLAEVTLPKINPFRVIWKETLQGSPSLRYVEQWDF